MKFGQSNAAARIPSNVDPGWTAHLLLTLCASVFRFQDIYSLISVKVEIFFSKLFELAVCLYGK